MDEDAFFEDESDSTGEHKFFDIAAGLGHAIGREGVIHRRDILGNDRTGIEFTRHKWPQGMLRRKHAVVPVPVSSRWR